MYLAERFTDAMKNGGRALFAGVGTEQLPVEFRNHPRVICWDSDSPQLTTERRIDLPPRVRVVVLSRFITHSAAKQLSKASKRASALYFGKVTGTGEIARILRGAFPPDNDAIPLTDLPAIPVGRTPTQKNGSTPGTDHVSSAATMTPAPARAPVHAPPRDDTPVGPFDTMTAAIRHFARHELSQVPPPGRQRSSPLPLSFYEGLAANLRGHGFPDVTVAQVTALFSNARGQERRAMALQPADTPPPVRVEDVPAPADVVVPTPPAPIVVAADPLPPDLDTLVQMAADLDVHAIAASELADQLRRLVTEQRALRTIKTRYDAMVAVATAAS
jgi:hypothetical protein